MKEYRLRKATNIKTREDALKKNIDSLNNEALSLAEKVNKYNKVKTSVWTFIGNLRAKYLEEGVDEDILEEILDSFKHR